MRVVVVLVAVATVFGAGAAFAAGAAFGAGAALGAAAVVLPLHAALLALPAIPNRES